MAGWRSSLHFLWVCLAFPVGAFLHTAIERRRYLRESLSIDLASSSSEAVSVVVIGGGWAGFSAADAVSTLGENVQVHLLDASPRGPGGLAGGWRTPLLNRSVEAGIHGFWREYRNTFAAMERIGLELDDELTPFTPSTLVSSEGKVAVAPVLGQYLDEASETLPSLSSLVALLPNPDKLLETLTPFLPPPLDLALLAEFEDDSRLSIADRVTGLGLLGPWVDFGQEDRESWLRYDKISADNLFRQVAGLSPSLYRELVSPLLHVLPMAPGWDCSAAAALSCFHVFALQTRGAFDVRWCRGSITERIFNPWVKYLQKAGNVDIRGKSKVTAIESSSSNGKPFLVMLSDETMDPIACDAVVLAVGATTAGRLVQSCPPLQALESITGKWKNLRGITCVAVRIFVDKTTGERVSEHMKESPVVVCGAGIGNIPALVETGFCVYDLSRLQDEYRVPSDKDDAIGAFEIDFFRAGDLADKEDEEVLDIALTAMIAALDAKLLPDQLGVLDSSVFRARDAVSHFCVGSADWSPPVRLQKGLYACGDWVDRTGHASWSTEKAVVTGRQAAKALGQDFGLSGSGNIDVIPAAEDSKQLGTLRQIASIARRVLPGSGIPRSPSVVRRGNSVR